MESDLFSVLSMNVNGTDADASRAMLQMILNEKQDFHKTWKSRVIKIFRRNLLVFLTLLGVGVGFAIGFAIAPSRPSASVLLWTGNS